MVPRAGVEPARSPLHRWVSVVPPLSPSFPTHLKGVQDRTPIVSDQPIRGRCEIPLTIRDSEAPRRGRKTTHPKGRLSALQLKGMSRADYLAPTLQATVYMKRPRYPSCGLSVAWAPSWHLLCKGDNLLDRFYPKLTSWEWENYPQPLL